MWFDEVYKSLCMFALIRQSTVDQAGQLQNFPPIGLVRALTSLSNSVTFLLDSQLKLARRETRRESREIREFAITLRESIRDHLTELTDLVGPVETIETTETTETAETAETVVVTWR